MNIHDLPEAFFLTGTDTGIGKTVVSAMLMLGLGARYWKPIQSGLKEETDTDFVKRITNLGEEHFISEQYRLTEPLSPHASARIDGISIEMKNFKLPEVSTRHLIVEGAGGLLVPINDKEMIIDLIQHLGLPVLLVCRSELGTLNHTFLSLEALRKRDIPIIGVIMNGPSNQSNKEAIEKYGKVKVIAELKPLAEMTSAALELNFNRFFKQ